MAKRTARLHAPETAPISPVARTIASRLGQTITVRTRGVLATGRITMVSATGYLLVSDTAEHFITYADTAAVVAGR